MHGHLHVRSLKLRNTTAARTPLEYAKFLTFAVRVRCTSASENAIFSITATHSIVTLLSARLRDRQIAPHCSEPHQPHWAVRTHCVHTRTHARTHAHTHTHTHVTTTPTAAHRIALLAMHDCYVITIWDAAVRSTDRHVMVTSPLRSSGIEARIAQSL